MTDQNPSAATPGVKPPSTTVLRIVVDADVGNPPSYGHQQMTVWVESGAERPGLAAAMVRLSDDGECFDALGWSPDGPRRLKIQTSHDDAVAGAILHAREVANGSERERAERHRRDAEREQARWDALGYDTSPPITFPE